LRQSTIWRTLLASTVTLSLAAQAAATPYTGHAATSGAATAGSTTVPSPIHFRGLSPIHAAGLHAAGLSAAEVMRLAQNADQHVIVILRNQHANLPARGATRNMRAAAIATDQQSVLSELAQVQAPRVHAYSLINAIAATVSSAELARLQSDPQVQAVVPDRMIKRPSPALLAAGLSGPAAAASGATSTSGGVTGPDSSCTGPTPSLEPQALQLTNTAFTDTTQLQAQNIVTGTGVKVAFFAEGIDITNPDFVRPDGSQVFVDYQDFTGDGLNAPTSGGEAFGDASSIAAQGSQVYDVSKPVTTTHPEAAGVFVNPAYNAPTTHCRIRIRGMAPGASLVGLKVFGQQTQSPTSNFVQAIQYAVEQDKVDVLSQSFGANPYPDNANDPITLADDAAVAAGVTVVVSSGDAGTAGTLGSPSTDPNVIEAGASTQFRFYAQTIYQGFQLGNGGYVDNNISAFSSAGVAQNAPRTVDVVAPGDLNWAVCTPDPSIYGSCTDLQGHPSRVEIFGGTSESAPLTAGEAALIIQAYRRTHDAATPSPAVVKQIVKSTATDLGIPSDEQGAGLINALKAVQAAESYTGSTAAPQGNALLVSPNALGATAAPHTSETFNVQVTNTGAQTQTVQPALRMLDAPMAGSSQSYVVALDPSTAPTFTDVIGRQRSYVSQPFTVPSGAQRLDAAISWNITQSKAGIVSLVLIDPQGRYTAYSIPQDPGPPFANSGYGHVDVANPTAGTWTAYMFTRTQAGAFGHYSGAVHLDVNSSRFTTIGSVSPASQALAPGQTGAFVVSVSTPVQPGDENATLVFDDSAGNPVAGAVPVVLRATVPLGPTGGSFSGTLTGGNGRFGSPGQTLTYLFDVPSGLKDLDLSLAVPDNNYNLEGILVDPTGLPIDVQSTVTALNPSTGLPAGYTNTLQFFRRDPQPGRWKLVFIINDNISGQQTTLPFTAEIQFNGVSVETQGVPNSATTTLPYSTPVDVPITVTNTGNTAKDFFIDPRLVTSTVYAALPLNGSVFTIPLTASETSPLFFVPSEATQLSIAAESMSPTVPISMDIYNANGAPPYGGTGSPDIEATSFLDGLTASYGAAATSSAPEVVPGLWGAGPTEVGPYGTGGAPPSTVRVGAAVIAQAFDTAAVPNTGDFYAALSTQRPPDAFYKPLTLGPGQQGTITVTLTPDAAPGTIVRGHLYVDTLNANSVDPTTGNLNLTTFSGDELQAIPFAYMVGQATVVTPTATVTSTLVATATGTAISATATGTSTAMPATATGTSTAVPATATGTAISATATSTSTAVPATSTSTAVPATSTSTAVPATSTSTAVPATSTSTAVPATSTSTAVPATSTSTAAPSMTTTPGSTGAPAPVCQFYVLPAFDTVPRGGEQALVFVAAPGSPITATIRAAYPVSATLYTDSSLDSSNGFGATLTGKRVPAGYRYAFHVEASGFALLTFAIPRSAHPGTVATRLAAREPCGLFRTSVTFEVRGLAHGGTTGLTAGRVVALALPQGDTLPASAGRLARRGVVRVVTHTSGRGRAARTTRTLLLTYRPRVAHHVMHAAVHKGDRSRVMRHLRGVPHQLHRREV